MKKAIYILAFLLLLVLLHQPPIDVNGQPEKLITSISDTVTDNVKNIDSTVNILVDSSIENTKTIVENNKKILFDSLYISKQERVIDSQRIIISALKQKNQTEDNNEITGVIE